MSLLKINVLLTGLLTLLVIVLAYLTFSLSSEVQQLRSDMAIWQQDATENGQEFVRNSPPLNRPLIHRGKNSVMNWPRSKGKSDNWLP